MLVYKWFLFLGRLLRVFVLLVLHFLSFPDPLFYYLFLAYYYLSLHHLVPTLFPTSLSGFLVHTEFVVALMVTQKVQS